MYFKFVYIGPIGEMMKNSINHCSKNSIDLPIPNEMLFLDENAKKPHLISK